MSTPTAGATTQALFAAAEAARAEQIRCVDAFRANINAAGYSAADLVDLFGFSRQAGDRHIAAARRLAAAPPGGRGTRTRIAVPAMAAVDTEDAA